MWYVIFIPMLNILSYLFSFRDISATHHLLCIMGVRIKIRKKLVDKQHYHNEPIQSNKIVFRSVISGYNCNPRYIAEEILRQKLPWELVWVVDEHILDYIDSFPEGVRLVMDRTEAAIHEYATAKVWITNGWQAQFVRRGLFRRAGEQVYVQTWHGSLGFKKLDRDRRDLSRRDRKVYHADAAQMDILISNSPWEDEVYKYCFWENGTIHRLGHARNDIFFKSADEQQIIRRKVCAALGISEEKKILLYAPTWRENGTLSCYTMDYERVKKSIESRFGGEWELVARWHPSHHASLRNKFLPSGVRVVNASNYPNNQELMVAADAAITDYSSCILDYMHTRRPAFLYVPDYSYYKENRGLYYPLEESPFPWAEDNDTLVQCIERFNHDVYKSKVEAFLKDKECMDDGHSAERIVELLKKMIAGEES